MAHIIAGAYIGATVVRDNIDLRENHGNKGDCGKNVAMFFMKRIKRGIKLPMKYRGKRQFRWKKIKPDYSEDDS